MTSWGEERMLTADSDSPAEPPALPPAAPPVPPPVLYVLQRDGDDSKDSDSLEPGGSGTVVVLVLFALLIILLIVVRILRPCQKKATSEQNPPAPFVNVAGQLDPPTSIEMGGGIRPAAMPIVRSHVMKCSSSRDNTGMDGTDSALIF